MRYLSSLGATPRRVHLRVINGNIKAIYADALGEEQHQIAARMWQGEDLSL